MVNLTNPPDPPTDESAARSWLVYAIVAGLASVAWTLGQRYVANPVSTGIDRAIGMATGGQAGDDPEETDPFV
jgi:hypothetical protein